MKKTAIILSVFALITSSCGQTTKKQVETNENADTVQISYNEIPETLVLNEGGTFNSSIRPNEKLQIGTTYTDTFEYIDFNDEGDDAFIDVKKNDALFPMIANESYGKWNDWARGDLYQIDWQIDTIRPAGDEAQLWIEYFALKTTKIKDGNISLFKKKYARPLKYHYDKESGFTESLLSKVYQKVEYYIANSKQDMVQKILNTPSANLGYSVEYREKDGKLYYVIGIYNDFENSVDTFQWLYLSEDLQKIFEYDLPNDELIEFQ